MDINRVYNELYEQQNETTQILMNLAIIYNKYFNAKCDADALQELTYFGSIFNPITANIQFEINDCTQTMEKEQENFFQTLENYQNLTNIFMED